MHLILYFAESSNIYYHTPYYLLLNSTLFTVAFQIIYCNIGHFSPLHSRIFRFIRHYNLLHLRIFITASHIIWRWIPDYLLLCSSRFLLMLIIILLDIQRACIGLIVSLSEELVVVTTINIWITSFSRNIINIFIINFLKFAITNYAWSYSLQWSADKL